jgi:hypothetical protein
MIGSSVSARVFNMRRIQEKKDRRIVRASQCVGTSLGARFFSSSDCSSGPHAHRVLRVKESGV